MTSKPITMYAWERPSNAQLAALIHSHPNCEHAKQDKAANNGK